MATVAGSKRLLDISGNNVSTAISLTASGTLLDTNGAAGASNQILSSTGSGVDWVNASSVIGGPYLPLTGGIIAGGLTVEGTTILDSLQLETSSDYITFYGGNSTQHSISSRQLNGSPGDDLRFNTYGSFIINLDSNNNQSSATNSSFYIARHGGDSGDLSSNILFDINGENGDVTMTGTLTAPNLTIGSGNKIQFANNDYIRYDDTGNRFHFDADGGASNASVQASAFVGNLITGNIGGNNYNITGVNQLEINDPGEGIVWKAGSSGDITLAVVDDSSDNILRLSGTGATLQVGSNNVFHDGYHPNADKWTAARTITLSGDLNGSVSIDGSSNVTLSAQVVNNSHTHDDRYVELTGDTMTGPLTISNNSPVLRLNDNDSTNTTNQLAFISLQSQSSETGWIGFGSSGNDNLTVKNTSGKVVLDGSTGVNIPNGSVGIGTTNPNAKLHVANQGQGEFAGANSSAGGGSHLMLKDEGSTSRTLMSGPSVVFQTPANADGTNVWATSRLLGSPAAAGSARGTFSIQVRDQYDPLNDGTSWNWRTALTAINSGNVGIGTTSPGAKLHVDGTAIFDTQTGAQPFYITRDGATNQALKIYVDDSTAVFESIQDETANGYGSFDFKLDAGVTEPYFDIDKNNTNLFRVNGDGNVGIGTIDPGAKLDVQGDIFARDNIYFLPLGTVTSPTWGIGLNGVNDLVIDDTTGPQNVIFSNSGNVGIGTTNPAAKLHVNGEARVYGSGSTYYVNMNANSSWGYFNTNAARIYLNKELQVDTGLIGSYNEALQLRTQGSTRMYISNTTGNVGIGTTSPDTLLQTTNTADGTDYISYEIGNTAVNASNKGGFAIYELGTKQVTLEYYRDGSAITNLSTPYIFTIDTNSQERMRITNAGNLGIGTTAPSYKLHVAGTTYANGSVIGSSDLWLKDQSSAYSTELKMQNNTHTIGIDYQNNETLRFITRSGTTTVPITFQMRAGTITAANFILSSDERKKTKIADLSCDSIDVSWKSFEMKDNEGEYRTGVIAQELEQKHPEFVNTNDEGFKSVKYIDLLIAKIAELEARLEKAGL